MSEITFQLQTQKRAYTKVRKILPHYAYLKGLMCKVELIFTVLQGKVSKCILKHRNIYYVQGHTVIQEGQVSYLPEEHISRGKAWWNITFPFVQCNQYSSIHQLRQPGVVILENNSCCQFLSVLTEQQSGGHRHPSHWKTAQTLKHTNLLL